MYEYTKQALNLKLDSYRKMRWVRNMALVWYYSGTVASNGYRICHLNMQLLCKKCVSFSPCTSLIIGDVSTNFTPLIRFPYSRCENSQYGGKDTSAPIYWRNFLTSLLLEGGSNLQIFYDVHNMLLIQKYTRCANLLAL